MKILLLEHPRIESDEHYNDVANAPLAACLSVGYVAAKLVGQGHSVEVYDAYGQDASFEQCCEQLLQRDCDMLGVHGVYFWEYTPQLFAMLQKYKSFRPETKLVLFGIFPTFAFKEILSLYPCVDAIILGEPEMTFCELAASYGHSAWRADAVAGIACLDRNGVKQADSRDPVGHLDMLPFPLRYDESLNLVGGSILGSRGCHGRCSFCCINPFYGNSSGRRCRTPENICREIEELLPELKKPYVYFLDADFFGSGPDSKSRVLAIAERLRNLGVQFGFECRAGSFDKAVIGTLARAGLKDVFLGIESASAATLTRMRKGIASFENAESVLMLRSLGIEPNLGFIMFEPDCVLADIRQNLVFLKDNSLLQKLDVTANVLYHREIAFRGMPNFARLAAAGSLTGSDAFGYEGQYRFADPSVQFQADLMSYVCRRVLRATENARSPICWKRGDSPPSQRVNDYIVNLFAETLRRLELKDIRLDLDALLRIEDDALCAIEGLIVEERVCQS
jgi:anaerobic magnesium-protoporphyrin IX monomethyl ester cyclase